MRQIFREEIPFFNSLIQEHFINVSPVKFCLSNDLYNHLLHKQVIHEFMERLTPYYIDKPLPHTSYRQFIKIIRHICKINNITYEYKTKYIGSSYTIEYYLTI